MLKCSTHLSRKWQQYKCDQQFHGQAKPRLGRSVELKCSDLLCMRNVQILMGYLTHCLPNTKKQHKDFTDADLPTMAQCRGGG